MRVRDFLVTDDRLLFSVVSNLHPSEGVLADLRFSRGDGMRRFRTAEESYAFLREQAPYYLTYCRELDREMTIVPRSHIREHLLPSDGLARMMEIGEDPALAAVVTALVTRSGLRLDEMGITGSYLVGAQTESSDMDLVVYGFANYPRVIRALLESVEDEVLRLPDEADWEQIYIKRGLDPDYYSLQEFIWHERRKYNRGKFGSKRFDILFTRKEEEVKGSFGDYRYTRVSRVEGEGLVSDSSRAIDCPATYTLSESVVGGEEVDEIVSYTHTYVDQVRKGERARFAGWLERVSGPTEYNRILVGSSRRAPGEYIKVSEGD